MKTLFDEAFEKESAAAIGVAVAGEVTGLNSNCNLYQVTVVTDCTGGSIDWEATPRKGGQYEDVDDGTGAQYSMDLALAARTFTIPEKALTKLKGTPAGAGLTGGTYWRFYVSCGNV